MSQPELSRTLPIGTAAQALGVTRDNLYKHIERGRDMINGIPFSAQQGPDKRWKVSIPADLSPYLHEGQAGQDMGDEQDTAEELSQQTLIEQLRAELDTLRQQHSQLIAETTALRAERDAYKSMIEATHQATLTTLERVVQKLTEPPALPEPEPKKKRSFWYPFVR